MNRREALKSVALLMGGTVIGAQAFLSGCTAEEKPGKELFSESDLKLMDEVGETILPETSTPGAKAVGIGSFMAMMVKDCYSKEEQKAFNEGLKKLEVDYKEQFGTSFQEGKAEDRLGFLGKLNEEFYNAQAKGEEASLLYFKMLKELTLLGYFTSEIGATQALRYIETPGRYDGCMPYKKGDKAWAV